MTTKEFAKNPRQEGRADSPNSRVDNLVIGSGMAGLTLALKLAEKQKVLLIAKTAVEYNNSYYAQGGIASVLSKSDSFASHVEDTERVGAGLCHKDIVEMVVKMGPILVQSLIEKGVKFTREESSDAFHLTQEGGHSYRRVVHSDDATGRAVMTALINRVKENENIVVCENQMAIDLVTSDKYCPEFRRNRCLGAYVLNRKSGEIYTVNSRQTFLCTGGHGKVYLYTSNPDPATGDGLAMGYRAGCKIANLEFMQFHPTCLFHPRAKNFLISEAVRGEGAVLKDHSGNEFMSAYHPLGSLAPRDVVARAIDTELKKSGQSHVFLDARHLGSEACQRLFPNILATCKTHGIDMTQEMLPVVPAAHYSCGGIVVDDFGKTTVLNLYALGETACTGLHGANRLASNSLLEALVFAERVGQHVLTDEPEQPIDSFSIPRWNSGKVPPADELVVLSHTWDEIRRLMWNYVGIVRSDKRLKRALSRIESVREELDTYYWEFQVTDVLLEVRNLALVAWLTIKCAMARKESRGIHFNIDYPDMVGGAKDTVL
jgi:L-aspartate oxidase